MIAEISGSQYTLEWNWIAVFRCLMAVMSLYYTATPTGAGRGGLNARRCWMAWFPFLNFDRTLLLFFSFWKVIALVLLTYDIRWVRPGCFCIRIYLIATYFILPAVRKYLLCLMKPYMYKETLSSTKQYFITFDSV